MADTLLQVDELSISFHSTAKVFDAVKDISFQINSGEILGLVGESGCGKTITALAVAGLLPKTAVISGGSIIFDGVPLRDINKESLRQISGKDLTMVFQEPTTSLNPLMTIGRQIAESLKIHYQMTKKERQDEVLNVLNKVHLPGVKDLYHRYPHQLSGGMLQRVMIAIAIVCKPKLIIADEPTTALDVTIQAQIIELLKEINLESKTALLFISHDLGVIRQLCDRIAVMYAGRIIEEGSVHDIFIHPGHEYTKGLIGSIPVREKRGKRLENIPGKVPAITENHDGCSFAPRCPKAWEPCLLKRPHRIDLGLNHRVWCYLAEAERETAYVRI